MIYPLISRTYYDFQASKSVGDYRENLGQLDEEERLERLKLANAYNSALLSSEQLHVVDPFDETEKKEGVKNYAAMVELKEKIGILTIPKIHTEFPVYAGTSENVLQKGVGHMEGTSLPVGGLSTHSVLTAHRGLPENKLFTDLDKMEIGDYFFVETIAGELAYQVVETKVIEPTDIDELAIEKNKDQLTLLTCTPYMINSHRLLVIGERTELPSEEQEELTNIKWYNHLLSLAREYIWVLGLLLFIFLVRNHRKRKSD